MKRRTKFAGLHFLVTALVATLSALLVFGVWYPAPYAAIAGGLVLFSMLIGIDVVVGPSLTALVAGPAKPMADLRRDIAVIVVLQLIAFAYGIYTIALARPVHLVFEVDRFVVVAAADIEEADLSQAPAALRSLPWTGPSLIGSRKPASIDEMLRSLDLAVQGHDVAMQPNRWIPYSESAPAVIAASREASKFLERYPQQREKLQAIATQQQTQIKELRYLPLTTRKADWVVLLVAPDARVVGFLPGDGF